MTDQIDTLTIAMWRDTSNQALNDTHKSFLQNGIATEADDNVDPFLKYTNIWREGRFPVITLSVVSARALTRCPTWRSSEFS